MNSEEKLNTMLSEYMNITGIDIDNILQDPSNDYTREEIDDVIKKHNRCVDYKINQFLENDETREEKEKKSEREHALFCLLMEKSRQNDINDKLVSNLDNLNTSKDTSLDDDNFALDFGEDISFEENDGVVLNDNEESIKTSDEDTPTPEEKIKYLKDEIKDLVALSNNDHKALLSLIKTCRKNTENIWWIWIDCYTKRSIYISSAASEEEIARFERENNLSSSQMTILRSESPCNYFDKYSIFEKTASKPQVPINEEWDMYSTGRNLKDIEYEIKDEDFLNKRIKEKATKKTEDKLKDSPKEKKPKKKLDIRLIGFCSIILILSLVIIIMTICNITYFNKKVDNTIKKIEEPIVPLNTLGMKENLNKHEEYMKELDDIIATLSNSLSTFEDGN